MPRAWAEPEREESDGINLNNAYSKNSLMASLIFYSGMGLLAATFLYYGYTKEWNHALSGVLIIGVCLVLREVIKTLRPSV